MLVLALQFSRAVRDAARRRRVAGRARCRGRGCASRAPAPQKRAAGDEHERMRVRAAPSKRNSDVRRSGLRWCLHRDLAERGGEGSEVDPNRQLTSDRRGSSPSLDDELETRAVCSLERR